MGPDVITLSVLSGSEGSSVEVRVLPAGSWQDRYVLVYLDLPPAPPGTTHPRVAAVLLERALDTIQAMLSSGELL